MKSCAMRYGPAFVLLVISMVNWIPARAGHGELLPLSLASLEMTGLGDEIRRSHD